MSSLDSFKIFVSRPPGVCKLKEDLTETIVCCVFVRLSDGRSRNPRSDLLTSVFRESFIDSLAVQNLTESRLSLTPHDPSLDLEKE